MAEIGVNHTPVADDLGRRANGDPLSLLEHDDPVADRHDEAEVVLNHQEPDPVAARVCSSNSARARDSVSFIPAAGSSRSRNFGRAASARAISSRLWSPYDRVVARRSASAASPLRSSTVFARRRLSARRRTRPHASSAASTFSRTVRLLNNRMFWNVRAMPERRICSGRCPASAAPPSVTTPELGFSMPEMQPSSVDLPDPFGPIRPTIVPGSISNETSSSAVTPPKRLVSALIWSGCRFASAGASAGGGCRPGIDRAERQEANGGSWSNSAWAASPEPRRTNVTRMQRSVRRR